MPVYKKTGKTGKVTWYAIFYYTDWTGTRKQKKKEGFATQREAKEYERGFLERVAGTPEMSFDALADLYLDDLRHRAKESTYINQDAIIRNHIRPFFGKLPDAPLRIAAAYLSPFNAYSPESVVHIIQFFAAQYVQRHFVNKAFVNLTLKT